MRQQTSRWESRYLEDEDYRSVGFKRLSTLSEQMYRITSVKVDAVNLDHFLNLEEDRIPLLIGSQFGIFLRLNGIPGFFSEPRIVALLSKSLLSGSVAGLTICLVPDSLGVWKVIKEFPERGMVSEQSTIKEINIGREYGCRLKSGKSLVIK